MSYAIGLPFTDTTLVMNCKCGTATLLTWVRATIKGWTYEQARAKNIHNTMRPACMNGMIYGNVIFVVRDPVHRFVSCYYDKVGNPTNRRYFVKGLSLEEYAKRLLDKEYLNSNEHWRPQVGMTAQLHEGASVRYVALDAAESVVRGLYVEKGIPTVAVENHKIVERRYTGDPYEIAAGCLEALRSAYSADFLLWEKANK